MKFFCVTAELAAPSFRFRVTQHLPGLRARGLAPEILPLPSSPWARWRAVRSLPPASIVLVHRTLLNSFELARLRRNGTRLLYDFDDAWTVPDPRPYDRAPRHADAPADATVASGHAATLVVGWLGTDADPSDLEDLAPALRELTRRHPSFRLRALGNSIARLPGVALEHRSWSLAREAEELLGFDVGIAPRRDDAWGRGRGGTEVLRLQAARRPVVCAPVGIHRDRVVDGESGYFARGTGEWLAHLDHLLRSQARRRELGEAGRARLEERLPIASITDRLAAALRG